MFTEEQPDIGLILDPRQSHIVKKIKTGLK